MTTQSTFPMNDLVLRLAGGHRDGELIPVSTSKCFLGMDEYGEGQNEQPHCAIFRGPKGAAVRSYGDDLRVNGIPATVHWLKEGDRIEFPNSMTVEVAQLGWIEQACSDPVPEQTLGAESNCESAGEVSNEFDRQTGFDSSLLDDCIDIPSPVASTDNAEIPRPHVTPSEDSNGNFENDPTAEFPHDEPLLDEPRLNETQGAEMSMTSNATEDPVSEPRLDLIESQIREIQSEKAETQNRLDRLDLQLVSLNVQLSQLVAAPLAPEPDARVAETPDTSVPEESFVTLGNHGPSEPELTEECTDASSTTEPAAEDAIEAGTDLTGNYYSHEDDDDEQIMTFDSTAPAEELELAKNVEINDAPAALASTPQEEIDSRQSKLAQAFSGFQFDSEAQPEIDHATANDQPEANHTTANEQPAESSESPTHGLDEEAVSFADQTIDAPKSEAPVGSDDAEAEPHAPGLEPGSLVSQLLKNVADESEDVPVEEPVPEPVKASFQSQSSVADLLERMKAEGQWEGVPDEDGPVDPIEPAQSPAYENPGTETEAESAGEEGADVQDYMSELLNRMRGGQPVEAPKPVVEKVKKDEKKIEKETAEAPEFVPPVNPMKPDEFKPMRKAQKIASLDAMRELANSTARSNVHKSEQRNRKELGYLQLGIAAASFIMAAYYFLVESVAFMDTGFIVGFFCIGLSGYLCYRYYSTIRMKEMVAQDPASPGKQPAAVEKTDAEPTLETVSKPEPKPQAAGQTEN